MNWTALRMTTVVLLALCLAVGCGGRGGEADGGLTETIAPAAPQPDVSGTDAAMTQTVYVEDSRSDAEGDGISSDEGTAASGTAVTQPPAAGPTTPPPNTTAPR